MEVIKVENVTKDYGGGKGVFDLSFTVKKGEVMGFLGPNGAGKTTTIRQLLGFIRPDEGQASIMAMDCFTDAAVIEENIGYLPGEIGFMDNMTGKEFIKFVAGLKRLKDLSRAWELAEFFQLNTAVAISKMSKGMKQKVALVCCFMGNPDTVILDEPTSGLDPLMQNKFVELIEEEKAKGTTVLMSSHIFEEVEKTCDRAVIIKEGKVVAVEDINSLRRAKASIVEITFGTADQAQAFAKDKPGATLDGENVILENSQGFNSLIRELANYDVVDILVRGRSLEELFMCYYGGEAND